MNQSKEDTYDAKKKLFVFAPNWRMNHYTLFTVLYEFIQLWVCGHCHRNQSKQTADFSLQSRRFMIIRKKFSWNRVSWRLAIIDDFICVFLHKLQVKFNVIFKADKWQKRLCVPYFGVFIHSFIVCLSVNSKTKVNPSGIIVVVWNCLKRKRIAVL